MKKRSVQNSPGAKDSGSDEEPDSPKRKHKKSAKNFKAIMKDGENAIKQAAKEVGKVLKG